MSTERERELRIALNDARVRKIDYRAFEVLAVIASAAMLLIALLLPQAVADTRQMLVWLGAGALCFAAYFSAYARVILQPAVIAAQEALNGHIEAHEAS